MRRYVGAVLSVIVVAVLAAPAGAVAPGHDDLGHDRLATPRLTLSPLSVLERKPARTVIGSLRLGGRTSGNGLRFALVSGTGSAGNRYVAVSGSTLRTARVLSSAATPTLRVRVRATNRSGVRVIRSFTIKVTAVNDRPVVAAPSSAQVDEDQSLVFSASDGTRISVADPDVGTRQAEVSLATSRGVLDLATTTGVTVSAGADHSGAVTLRGRLSAINGALNGLEYDPPADASGAATLTVRADDLGGTGAGGRKTGSRSVPISIGPVNDAPSFAAGPDQLGVLNIGGSRTVDPWATGVSPGPGEGGQTLTFEVTTSDTSLFLGQPAVSPTGVLTFTPDPSTTGTATVAVRLADDGGTAGGGDDTSGDQTFTIQTVAAGPAITSVSPDPLVPGGFAILAGRQFSPTAANNVVTIGGVAAPVTAATSTALTVAVPCVSSDDAIAVTATVGGTPLNTIEHPLLVPQRDLDVGEATIVTDLTQIGCNEITSANGPARYVVAAYNVATSPASSAGIRLSSDPVDDGSAPPAPRGEDLEGVPSDAVGEGDEHTELLEKNRAAYRVLRREFGTAGVPRRGPQPERVAADLPLTRTFRISNITGVNVCNNYFLASATRVYAEGKLVIYEDDATPSDLKAANNPAMAGYYDQIGDQFTADMEPIVRLNFGDILRRDAVTDDNGVMIALSTPRLNTSFLGVAGFVITCDQFLNDDTSTPAVGGPYTGTGVNGASNFGEFFYLYQPTATGSGYSGNTADNWYRTVRSTFIHESKHVASQAARVANDAPAYELGWLEEGTARHAEELWARQSVYNVPWKGNTGYGSAAAPNSIYCDARPSGFPECAGLPRRPSVNMTRHFSSLYTYLYGTNSRLLSPYGATPSDNASYYYATSWSLVRYAIDRYGTSDAHFLGALTQSTATGVSNLSQRTGVSSEQLLGRWALAMAVDDYPGLATPSADVQMPTWNLRSIYAGLNADFPSTYGSAYPGSPVALPFGSISTPDVATIYGGGVQLFELSGTQTAAQLLRLRGSGGGALGSTIRLAIVRVQ